MSMGVIEGGWGFVWAAYLVTAVVLGGYTISVVLRLRDEQARSEREARRTEEAS